MTGQRTLRHAWNIAFNLRKALGPLKELFEDCSFPTPADNASGGFHRAKLRLLSHLLLGAILYTTYDFVAKYLDITASCKDTSIRHAPAEATRKDQPGSGEMQMGFDYRDYKNSQSKEEDGSKRHAATLRAASFAMAVLILAGIAAGCSGEAKQAAPAPPQVSVAEVICKQLGDIDVFTGRLEAVTTVEVRPRVSGYLQSVHFQEGAIVRQGDLLFQIDPRPFQAEVDRLKGDLAQAKAQLARAQSDFERAERLHNNDGMSAEEYDRRAAVRNETEARIASTAAALRGAELNLEFTRVTAPIAGRVSRAEITAGGSMNNTQPFFVGTFGRLRTVEPTPDGNMWMATSNGGDKDSTPNNSDNKLLHVEVYNDGISIAREGRENPDFYLVSNPKHALFLLNWILARRAGSS